MVFWHRLALALGGTVAELQDRMPYREFLEWVAFYQIEPWGDVRGDMQTALLAGLTANIHRDRKKQSKAFTPADFMPDFWRKTQGASSRAAAVAGKAMAIFGQMTGARDE